MKNFEANFKPNMKLDKQVYFLAEYLLTKFNDEMGKGESPNGEGAIEMAVRLLDKYWKLINKAL